MFLRDVCKVFRVKDSGCEIPIQISLGVPL